MSKVRRSSQRPKQFSESDGRSFLSAAFRYEQEVLRASLDLAANSITHEATFGAVAEQCFVSVMRRYLPKRYSVDPAIVLDSSGLTSDQIDIVIYDSQYTPTMLDQQGHKYVPAEAVYAIFEVKQTLSKSHLDYAAQKAKSVRRLARTGVTFRTATGRGASRQTYLLAGILTVRSSWSGGIGGPLLKHHRTLKPEATLDCGLTLEVGGFDNFDRLREVLATSTVNDESIARGVYRQPTIYSSRNCLARFLFRLLGILQFLGTVPALDWNAYARTLGK